jgi:hypothetical protein
MHKRKRYKFIGRDGSLGLKKGNYYVIDLKTNIFTKKVLAYIYDGKFITTCPYTSIKTFKQNWELW